MNNQKSSGSLRSKGILAGILILTAYFVLVSAVTDQKAIVMIFEVISGLSVIGIALIVYPLVRRSNEKLGLSYYLMKWFEGSLMVISGVLFFVQAKGMLTLRENLYLVHTYVFIVSAFILYYLFLKSKRVPKWLSIWGIIAVVLLTIGNVLQLAGLELPMALLALCFSQIMINEVVLAIYLMVKGFAEVK